MKVSISIFASSFPGQVLQPPPHGVKVKGGGVVCKRESVNHKLQEILNCGFSLRSRFNIGQVEVKQ